MEWGSIAKQVGKFAPLLGDLLPIPGAGVAGRLIASALGVDHSPDAVAQAMRTDPDAGVKLAKIEADNRAELQRQLLTAESARIASVNQTMQAESESEHWPQYSWRPFWGFISGAAFFVVCVLVCLLAYQAVMGGKPEAMAMIPQIIGAFAALFAIPGGILGVSAWHRGKMQVEITKKGKG